MGTGNATVTVTILASEYERLKSIERDFESVNSRRDKELEETKNKIKEEVDNKLENCDDIVDLYVNFYTLSLYGHSSRYVCKSRDKIIQKLIDTLGINDFCYDKAYYGMSSCQIGGKEYTYNEECSELLEKQAHLSKEVDSLTEKKDNLALCINKYKEELGLLVDKKVNGDISKGVQNKISVFDKIKNIIKTF